MTAALRIVESVPHDHYESFWESRERLGTIRQQARARRVSPWAVLGGVLARIIAATPPQVQLPSLVGGFGSLNLFVNIVGRSGQGKGASQAAASALVEHVGGAAFGELTVGTGEGLSAAYVERTKDDDGHSTVVQHAESALFDIAEVDTLSALANRQGATLISELRKIWSGERLGFQNRDSARTLPVDAHTYRASLIVGVQPNRSGALLNDADGGTPQRFVWLSATDPDAPNVAPHLPHPIRWMMPNESVLPTVEGRRVMHVCDTARNIIDFASIARLRGQGDALDGHALLSRLKIAAALALLDERGDVNDEDWELSGVIMAESDRVRQSCQDALRDSAKQENEKRAELRAEASLVAADHTIIAALERCKASILKQVTTEWISASKVRKNLTPKMREYFDQCIVDLLDIGAIESSSDRYKGQDRMRYRLGTRKGVAISSPLPVTPELRRPDADLKGDNKGVTESPPLPESVTATTVLGAWIDPGYCPHGVTIGERCSKCGGHAQGGV